jgi:hypothetical protein
MSDLSPAMGARADIGQRRDVNGVRRRRGPLASPPMRFVARPVPTRGQGKSRSYAGLCVSAAALRAMSDVGARADIEIAAICT